MGAGTPIDPWCSRFRRIACRDAYRYAAHQGIDEHRVLALSKVLSVLPGELLAAIATGALRRRQRLEERHYGQSESRAAAVCEAPPLIAGESRQADQRDEVRGQSEQVPTPSRSP